MRRWRRQLRGVWTTIEGLRIYGRVSAGSGPAADVSPPAAPVASALPPVVLVHGLSVSSDYMMPTAVRLATSTWVGAPDMPGFGESQRPRPVFDLDAHADVLAAWMRAMGHERAALLGNSLGCQLIAHFAVRYPQMIEAAVLVGPALDPHAGTPRQVGRLLLDGLREPLRFWPIVAHDYLRAGLTRTWRTFRLAQRDQIAAVYAGLRVPTLVVRGGRDPIVPQAWAEELTRLLPDARLVVIPRAAHAVNFSAPEALVRVVVPFLAEASPASGAPGDTPDAAPAREAREAPEAAPAEATTRPPAHPGTSTPH